MSITQRSYWFRVIPLCFALLLIGGGLRAVGGQDPFILTGEPSKGRDLFISQCIRCHAIWGVGGKLGPDLTQVGMGRSLLQIAGSLWSHSPQMIKLMEERHLPRPSFTPEQIQDLITYLYYLNYFNEPGDPKKGQQIFSQKGCMNCHSIGQTGGTGGPRLDTYQRYGSPLYVAQAMWNHGPRMTSQMMARGVKPPTFQGREMADLLAFIRGRVIFGVPEQPLALSGDPMAGQRLFAQKACLTCHAIRGVGGTVGPDLGREGQYSSVTSIAGAMWNHGPAMEAKMKQLGIARPQFSKNEMADLIAYFYFVGSSDPRGDQTNGKKLFTQKGCAACHALGESEQKIGPDLATSAAITSPLHLAAAMWNHAPTMEKLAQEKGLPWPKFAGNEMRDLVEYIRSFARGSAARETRR